MLSIAIIDQQLSQQGQFCLLDWLLSENLLHYSDYEDWRYARTDSLEPVIQLDKSAFDALILAAEKHGKALGLCKEPQDFYHWDEQTGALKASPNSDIHSALTQQWLRPQDVPQLDLFMDNSAVVAENSLRDALAARHFDQAQQQLQQLVELNSQHQRLGAYQDLINYGQHICEHSIVTGDDALQAELQGLQQEVAPLAQESLGQAARDYLAFAWRRLANSLQGLVFDPAQPERHASFALRQIPDWPQLSDCLQAEPGLYQQPLLIQRLADTREAMQRHETALLTWCVLFERFGELAEAAIDARPQSPVSLLWDSFWDLNDTWPSHYFPSFILAKHPGLMHHLHSIPELDQPANAAMIALLQCRQKGEDEIVAREQLQTISPALLRMYMQVKN